MPSLAWNALEAGFHASALGRLAALNKPNWSEVQHLLARVRRELGMEDFAMEEASYRVAKQPEILESGKDPLLQTRAFELLWTKAGYPAGLAVGGSLDDAVNVARCMGSPDTEIRLQVAKASTEFREAERRKAFWWSES
jgi:hypothetical protein